MTDQRILKGESEGGIGILHKNARDTINELKKLRSPLKLVKERLKMHKYYNKNYIPKVGEDALPWLQYRKRVRRNRYILIGMITICLIMGTSLVL